MADGFVDGLADGFADGVATVVDVAVDGVLLCVAARAAVVAPAPIPPATTAVITARRSSTLLAVGIRVSFPERAAGGPGWLKNQQRPWR